MPLASGETLDGRYRLVEKLGAGGQGEVWRAHDTLSSTGPSLAVKLVSVGERSPAALERLRREARTLYRLEHPSLVRCHRVFEDLEKSVLGLVFDYVDGFSLSVVAGDQRFSRAHHERILGHVARGLSYLHEHGVVHRDLKPANIMIARRFMEDPADPAVVKIVDLGIATPAPAMPRLTDAGRVIGTAAYMAPEQLDPGFWQVADDTPAVDVFAFCCIAFELLAGGHPTGLASSATFVEFAAEYRSRKEQTLPVPVLDEPWRCLMVRGLALHLGKRIANGAGLVRLLDGPIDVRDVSQTEEAAIPVPPLEPAPRSISDLSRSAGSSAEPVVSETRPRSNRWRARAVAFGVFAMVGTAALLFYRNTRQTPTRQTIRVPAGVIPNGDSVGEFEYRTGIVPSGATFVAAANACRRVRLELCTEYQWLRACAESPENGREQSWTTELEAGGDGRALIAVRGGGSCDSAAFVHGSATAEGRAGICCTRAIASSAPTAATPALLALERARNSSDGGGLLLRVLAPRLEKFYTTSGLDREHVIALSRKYYADHPNQFTVHARCKVSGDASYTELSCRHYLFEGDRAVRIKSRYGLRNGVFVSVGDYEPVALSLL